MIRWRYVIPRFVFGLAVALFLWLGVNPIVRWMLVSNGQAMTGARVDIDGVDASILAGRIQLEGIEIANPNSPGRNLVEAQQALFDLDVSALLNRQLVVTDGRLSGVQIDTVRDRTGGLDTTNENHVGQLLARKGAQWFKQFALQTGEGVIERSETVAVSNELLRRWPNDYEHLVTQAASLQARIGTLRRLIENSSTNPLHGLEVYRQAIAELESLQQEYRELRSTVQDLPRRAQQDRDALLAAKRRDEQKIRELGQLARLNGDALSFYLLGPEQAEQLETVMTWIQWARQLIPDEERQHKPSRMRGDDIVFAGARRGPNFLIQRLAIDGVGSIDDRPFHFAGTVTDLTSEPKVLGRPAAIAIETHGAVALQVEAIVDRTSEIPHDRLFVKIPSLQQPRRVLGQDEQLALVIPPGELRLTVDIDLRGERIDGRVILTQAAEGIQAKVASEYGGTRLAAHLDRVLVQLGQIEAVVEVSGTVSHPDWKLHSTLGRHLASSFEQVLDDELNSQREQLVTRLNDHLKSQLERFDQLLAAKQEEVFSRLRFSHQEMDQLRQHVASRQGVPTNLGGQPFRELFRR